MKKIQALVLAGILFFAFYGCAQRQQVPAVPEAPPPPPVVKAPEAPPAPKTEPPLPPFVSQKPDLEIWANLGKTCSGETFYKKEIKKLANDVIVVSTYKIISEDFRLDTVQQMEKNDSQRSKLYKRYDHNIRVDEIDCKKSAYRLREVSDYDDMGNLLANSSYENEPWQRIPVLTGLDALRKKFCTPADFSQKGK